MRTSAKGKARKATPPATAKQPTKKKAKSNIILTTLAVGAAGILGYLGWQYYKKRKASKNAAADFNTLLQSSTATYQPSGTAADTTTTPTYVAPVTTTTTGQKTTSTASTASNSGFPLKKGSKGSLVKALQQALIAKYSASILPKYGADGDFGSETVTAVAKAGLPATIDESTYYVFVQGSSSVTDKSALAAKFLTAASNKDFNTVMSLLKQMSTKEDYRQVSNIFVQSILRGVRQTLVNGLLGSFTNETQKQQIRYEFIRMGLKYDGSKWSLDGFDGKPIVTVEPTNVWLNATESVGVPASMVLGAEVSRKLDYTLFENKGRYFLVATRSVKYL
jgi:hypothetical protein